MKPTTAQLVTKLSAYTVPAVLRDLLLQSRDAGIPSPKIINIPLLAQTYAVAVHVPLASLAHLSQEELTLVRSDLLATASNYLHTVTHGHLHKRSSKYMTGVVSMAVADSADGLYYFSHCLNLMNSQLEKTTPPHKATTHKPWDNIRITVSTEPNSLVYRELYCNPLTNIVAGTLDFEGPGIIAASNAQYAELKSQLTFASFARPTDTDKQLVPGKNTELDLYPQDISLFKRERVSTITPTAVKPLSVQDQEYLSNFAVDTFLTKKHLLSYFLSKGKAGELSRLLTRAEPLHIALSGIRKKAFLSLNVSGYELKPDLTTFSLLHQKMPDTLLESITLPYFSGLAELAEKTGCIYGNFAGDSLNVHLLSDDAAKQFGLAPTVIGAGGKAYEFERALLFAAGAKLLLEKYKQSIDRGLIDKFTSLEIKTTCVQEPQGKLKITMADDSQIQQEMECQRFEQREDTIENRVKDTNADIGVSGPQGIPFTNDLKNASISADNITALFSAGLAYKAGSLLNINAVLTRILALNNLNRSDNHRC